MIDASELCMSLDARAPLTELSLTIPILATIGVLVLDRRDGYVEAFRLQLGTMKRVSCTHHKSLLRISSTIEVCFICSRGDVDISVLLVRSYAIPAKKRSRQNTWEAVS